MFLLFSLPGLIHSFAYFNFFKPEFYAFGCGILFYGVTMVIVGYNTCHTMQIISHELTHTFFAYLTLHNVGTIRLNPDGSGGSMSLKGRGNWLITLSPYFFPLLAFFYMVFMPNLLKISANSWLVYAIYGYFIAYYWVTVMEQVHLKQTDIIKEGYVFSFIVIVVANLYVTGIALAFNSKLWSGVEIYVRLVYDISLKYAENLIQLIYN